MCRENPVLYGEVHDLWWYVQYISPDGFQVIRDLFEAGLNRLPSGVDPKVWLCSEKDSEGDYVLQTTLTEHLVLCELLCHATMVTGDRKYAKLARDLHNSHNEYIRVRRENASLN